MHANRRRGTVALPEVQMAQNVVADPADVSLELAVDALFDAYGLTFAERKLLLAGAALPELEEEPAAHEPGEACRTAVLLAATAVETRLNRVFGPFELVSEVRAAPLAEPPAPLDPRTARAMVETCALICTFLSTLVGRAESETERCARRVAEHLRDRELTLPEWYDEWDSSDFPPNILGS